MAAQDVADLVPRVRRAIEGPAGVETGALSDEQVEALTADCIADIILLTSGQWGKTLEPKDPDEKPTVHWTVDPALTVPEESLVASQAALTYFFHQYKDAKTTERITVEGREWEWGASAQLMRDYMKLLQEQRDEALAAAQAANPVMARYASILAVRDRLAAAQLEPWTTPGGEGGYVLIQ
jgi:hypothetical protein